MGQAHLDAQQLVLAPVVDHPVNLTAHNNVQVVGGVEGPAAVPGECLCGVSVCVGKYALRS